MTSSHSLYFEARTQSLLSLDVPSVEKLTLLAIAHLGDQPDPDSLGLDFLTEKTGFPERKVVNALVSLETKGFIKQRGNAWDIKWVNIESACR